MSILINIGLPEWMADESLKKTLEPMLGDAKIYCGEPKEVLPDVEMMAVVGNSGDIYDKLPNLRLIQKLGAGVNSILDDPYLPAHMRITRLAPAVQAQEITEYALGYVLYFQRHIKQHEDNKLKNTWKPIEPKRSSDTTIGILGLGHIGKQSALLLASMGFKVKGWSRSPKMIQGVESYTSKEGLFNVLTQSDYLISILPSTQQTKHLINSSTLNLFKPNAILINAGRGDLIDDGALVKALDNNLLSGAVLDVFQHEPLDKEHPFWRHPKIIITPHVSGWHIDGAFEQVAENYQRLIHGRDLLHEIDRANSY